MRLRGPGGESDSPHRSVLGTATRLSPSPTSTQHHCLQRKLRAAEGQLQGHMRPLDGASGGAGTLGAELQEPPAWKRDPGAKARSPGRSRKGTHGGGTALCRGSEARAGLRVPGPRCGSPVGPAEPAGGEETRCPGEGWGQLAQKPSSRGSDSPSARVVEGRVWQDCSGISQSPGC